MDDTLTEKTKAIESVELKAAQLTSKIEELEEKIRAANSQHVDDVSKLQKQLSDSEQTVKDLTIERDQALASFEEVDEEFSKYKQE
eukprot:CAMPEP_0170496420 /NCGR_PEP_ID=MMETSP0208-20121228/21462_1 /TAXON_ID=197538 /ORGANISM="Strombidium inclinatum, Strain S3" /LENGTH=85 /DNA_ID=CAMNT_0010772965 /DNA_START=891 /DNA_END=1148 /DNA_ORIENTATION=+